MKIGTKLLACMAAVLAIAIVLGVAACLTVRSLGKTTDHIVNVTIKKRTLVGELNTEATNLLAQERGIVLGAILQHQPAVQEQKSQVQETLSKSDSLFRNLDPTLETEEDRNAVSRLQEQFHAVRQAHEELLQFLDRQQFDQVQKIFDERVLPKLLVIGSDCERLVRMQSGQLAGVAREATDRSTASWWMLLILISAAVLAGAPVFHVIRGINRKLRYVAGQMAEGSDQVAAASTEVSSASHSLAQGASEQAASLEETATSSEEITSMTQKNAENSRQMAELMGQVDACVTEANRTLSEMVLSMRDINASSDRISKIIKVIDEIAFQTNILALNAAVEAARAGEAGMGFAVVADEVRNLAQRCAQAAKDTADLIEESIAKSTGGSTKLKQMETAIQAITQSATKVRTLVDEVSLGSQEQARGIQHIARSISRMEAMTQRTAASAEESASASEQLSAQAKAMETLVHELHIMVDGSNLEQELASRPASKPRLVRPRPEETRSRFSHAAEAGLAKRRVNGPLHVPSPAEKFPLDEEFKEF